eukprot:2655876-Pleurochrysis_carterae.AAC.1
MELARSNLVAASAPTYFWDFAVLHAVDILNRTSTPPGGDKSSYEMVTGDKPSIWESCLSAVKLSLSNQKPPCRKRA